jgi:hypothetical protein
MKTNKLLLLAGMLAGAAATPASAAERVIEASELPPAVREVIDGSTQGETVKKLSVRNAGGRTVYDVEFEPKNGSASACASPRTARSSATREKPLRAAPMPPRPARTRPMPPGLSSRLRIRASDTLMSPTPCRPSRGCV